MPTAKRKQTSLKALFIGNSFTARNNLPAMIGQFAAAHGRDFAHRLINVGGASLRTHWNGAEAQKVIKDGNYDVVVLQEQSTLPIKNAQRMHENVRLFDDAIKAAGSRMFLYMTWARAHAPETQQAITHAYKSIGQELGATVVPVGDAWQRFLRTHNKPGLYDKDQSHPSLAGTYLAASVFFAMLFKENPVDIDVEMSGLEAKDMLLLRKTAWRTCQSNAKVKRK